MTHQIYQIVHYSVAVGALGAALTAVLASRWMGKFNKLQPPQRKRKGARKL
jgi:hypothetical protein